ncbi:MAG: hypothetical protein ACXW4E_06930 [Anaerolineales bacterium]
MPHYGLMDATKMTEADAALMRSQLHLRGAKCRLQKGLIAAGMVALYDSVLFGMRYYVARHERCAAFVEHIDLWDAASLFHALARAGVFDNPLTFNRFSLMVERALWQRSFSFDADATFAEVEMMLTQLGVMPFDPSIK